MVSITQPIIVWARPPESQTRRDVASPKTEQLTSNHNGRQNSRLFLGCLLVAGLGFTAFCLLKRSKTQAASPSHIKITALTSEDAKQYSNEERWSIRWNDEGLPIEIVIHRHAVQS